jgi:TolB-like protein
MVDTAKAVFLSYASQDAEAARRICESLRAAGIEVWFDQSELRGGDAWDQKIRQQIHDCALFVPIISANTESRTEGYFRLEWKLAVDRSHLMADDAAFLFPVVIDDTPDQTARVPDKFRTVQWTRLPGGEAPAAFSQRVAALLAGSVRPIRAPAPDPGQLSRRASRWAVPVGAALLLATAAGLSYWWSQHRAMVAVTPSSQATEAAASAAPPHSVAVLPFADLSAAGDQQYFSDGLAEELLNLLSKVPGLQVAARTSAFSFKGKAADIPTIGRQLKVANVLEGSVRKVGNHLRVSAQLVRADNGYEVWSGMYDRELGDIFRLQDEISAAVVKALKVTLLEGNAPRSPSTQNTDAYLVFLKGRAKMASERIADIKSAAEDFTQVIKLDPNYGPAYVELATARAQVAEFEVIPERRSAFDRAVEESELLLDHALSLDPSNAQAYVERGYLRAFSDIKGAEQDYRRAIELDPNSARGYAGLAAVVDQDPSRLDETLVLLDKARRLDPLRPDYDELKARALLYRRGNVAAADALLTDVVARHPSYQPALTDLGLVRYFEGRFAEAVMYWEQALKLDPLSEWTRQILISAYFDVGEPEAGRHLIEQAPRPLPVERLRLLIYQRDWHQAAEVTYAAIADGTLIPVGDFWGFLALRMDARATRDYRRARATLEGKCGVTWNAHGIPTVAAAYLGPVTACVYLGDVLIASGERERGERILRATIANMNYAARDLKESDLWFVAAETVAYALLGDRKATIAAMRRAAGNFDSMTWWARGVDPAMHLIDDDPEYQALNRRFEQHVVQERQRLDQMRAEGRVPVRGLAAGRAAPEKR